MQGWEITGTKQDMNKHQHRQLVYLPGKSESSLVNKQLAAQMLVRRSSWGRFLGVHPEVLMVSHLKTSRCPPKEASKYPPRKGVHPAGLKVSTLKAACRASSSRRPVPGRRGRRRGHPGRRGRRPARSWARPARQRCPSPAYLSTKQGNTGPKYLVGLIQEKYALDTHIHGLCCLLKISTRISKSLAYGKHWISWHMEIVAPMQQ